MTTRHRPALSRLRGHDQENEPTVPEPTLPGPHRPSPHLPGPHRPEATGPVSIPAQEPARAGESANG